MLSEIQEAVREETRIRRNLYNLVNSFDFATILEKSSSHDQNYLLMLVVSPVDFMIYYKSLGGLELLSYKELRDLARVLKIKNYCSLLKSQLVEEIKDAQRKNEKISSMVRSRQKFIQRDE
jgi:hypothetical protein